MALFLPKNIKEEQWKPLVGNKAFAIRSNSDEVVYLRLGKGKSFFIEIVPMQFEGRLINSVEYDSGEESLLHRLPNQTTLAIGRTSETPIKIMHSYISRRHMELTLDSNIITAMDLGSINGSFYYSENVAIDIDKYLAEHPLADQKDKTLDEVHVAFGPTLDDFLKRYLEKKGNVS